MNGTSGIIGDPNDADQRLRSNFKQTSNPKIGDVIRYAYLNGTTGQESYGYDVRDKGTDFGGTSHYASFLLKNENGTIYVFSKNGAGESGAWTVTTDNQLRGYGSKTPIGTGSPFYTKK